MLLFFDVVSKHCFLWFLHAKTFENHSKNNGCEAFPSFWKTSKKHLKINPKWAGKSPKSMKNTLPKSIRFCYYIFWDCYSIWAPFWLHWRIILVSKSILFPHESPMHLFYRLLSILDLIWEGFCEPNRLQSARKRHLLDLFSHFLNRLKDSCHESFVFPINPPRIFAYLFSMHF